jgi:hypothetical protein
MSDCLHKLLLAAALISPVIVSGCAARVRYYDAPHSDYHRWGPAERDPYMRWENDRHRSHRDYRRLKQDERQDYWNWRHEHP